jgi:hypothetical protein
MDQKEIDLLKHFIDAHRNAFDTQTPPPLLWERIVSGLPVPKKSPGFSRLTGIAATFLALVVCSLLVVKYQSSFTRNNDASLTLSLEVKEAEAEYHAQVQMVMDMKDPAFMQVFNVKEFTSDDGQMDLLKREMDAMTPDQRTNAMQWLHRHYSRKLEALESLLKKYKRNEKSIKAI